MASSRSNRARWAVLGLAVLVLCVAGLAAAASARADPWWAETTQATVPAQAGPADAIDRYLDNQQQPIVKTVVVPAADSGFQVDWANIGIGVGVAAVVGLVVFSAAAVVRHGGHGGPGRPVMHG